VTAAELLPGLHRLEEPDGRRRLAQVVVEGGERTLIVDAGLPESPERGLLPFLRSRGLDRAPIVLLLTHPDADHRGGAPVLREAVPELEIWGHELDADQLSDPEVALAERYHAFAETDAIVSDPERVAAVRARLGRPLRLDRRLSGDVPLDLGGRSVEILHTPGHSPGSVAAWLPEKRAALVGDAVMGRGIPYVDGSLMYPPMFSPPRTYEATIERLEALGPRLIVSGHEPPLRDDAAMEYLAASRRAAGRLCSLVAEALDEADAATLTELCSTVAERYPGLPFEAASSLAMTVDGALGELVGSGRATVEPGPPRRWRSAA
jgi:glyoxylase-like metal-dependent hydrolase (beta-lactamase superfamily II)